MLILNINHPYWQDKMHFTKKNNLGEFTMLTLSTFYVLYMNTGIITVLQTSPENTFQQEA